jgi:hypothetical protein
MGEITKSKAGEHSWDEDHIIQQDKTEILHKVENRMSRKPKDIVLSITGK